MQKWPHQGPASGSTCTAKKESLPRCLDANNVHERSMHARGESSMSLAHHSIRHAVVRYTRMIGRKSGNTRHRTGHREGRGLDNTTCPARPLTPLQLPSPHSSHTPLPQNKAFFVQPHYPRSNAPFVDCHPASVCSIVS